MNASTHRFTYNAATRTFIAEASDFGSATPLFHQIYPDACDQGITLTSHRTGESANFFIDRELRSGGEDNELQGWELKPTTESVRHCPGLANTKVVIFND